MHTHLYIHTHQKGIEEEDKSWSKRMYANRRFLQKYPKRTVYNFTRSESAWKEKKLSKIRLISRW